MFASFGITESFCETEVDNVNIVLFFTNSDKEIVRFYISMQEMSRVNKLNSLKHLISKH